MCIISSILADVVYTGDDDLWSCSHLHWGKVLLSDLQPCAVWGKQRDQQLAQVWIFGTNSSPPFTPSRVGEQQLKQSQGSDYRKLICNAVSDRDGALCRL